MGSSEVLLQPGSGLPGRKLFMRSGEKGEGKRAEAQREIPVPGILGEVRCLKLELDTERSRAEQERENAARQLVQAEQEGHTALQQQKSAHEEEVNRLQEKWVGHGCGWGQERQMWPPFSECSTH